MKARRFKSFLDATAGALTVALLGAIKHTDRRRMANFAGAFMRKVGPLSLRISTISASRGSARRRRTSSPTRRNRRNATTGS
jgi:hypothetical protein